jgi:hypothetical protein
MNKCKSCFDYTLELSPDGNVSIKDKSGNVLMPGSTQMPPIKKILNTRTITITEAEGSGWIYVDPPGIWIQV